ncbi:MAG TPA: hypothetical protein VM658_11400 [bacterium]|nr:hypothetical protein [bacterium]
MKSKTGRLATVLLACLLVLLGSCLDDGSGDGGSPFFPPPPSDPVPIVITVTPDAGGFLGQATPSNSSRPWWYPGVDAYLVNNRIRLTNVAVSPDGSRVAFNIEATAGDALDMAWFKLWTSAGTLLAAGPTVVNGRGENIFVAGPLVPGTPSPMTVKLTPAGPDGYKLYFHFFMIGERIAFMSDRANPGAGKPKEIFTVRPDGADAQAVTSGSIYDNVSPVWSPGREWIAFERFADVVMCGSTVATRLQVFAAHPDGSNLTRLSRGMSFASDVSFNPSGRLLAYDCQPECQPGTTTDICLYDLAAGTQKMLFNGHNYGFVGDQLLIPRWSPDGKYMIMRGNRASDGVVQWVYSDMDPATGDSLSSPVVFIRGNKGALKPDGKYYRLVPWDFGWGPDSRHVVVNTELRQWDGDVSWPPVFSGLAIFDFAELSGDTTLPDVPDITRVVDTAAGNPNFPCFSADGSRLFYDRFHNSAWTDLQYTPISDYAPTVFNQRISFLADGHYNRTPALMPPVLSEFFPLIP